MAAKPLAYQSPWRTPEHEALASSIEAFFTREIVPLREQAERVGHPDPASYRRAGDLGLLGLAIPEEYGGGGGNFFDEAVLYEQQAYAGDVTLGLGVHTGIVMGYIETYGTPEQKAKWLPKLCSGEWVGSIAMTEPSGGSDLQAIRTRAIKDGDDYVVTGSKTFITNGYLSQLVVLAVKTDPDSRAAGISLLVCEVNDDTPGFKRGRMIEKIGMHGNDTAELFFDGMRVPIANRLGPQEGQGFVQMMQQLPQERLVVSIASVAAMESAVRMTIAYTKERTAFGKTIFEQQNTRFVLAEATAQVRAARTLLDDALARHVKGELDVATAALVKYWTTDVQNKVIDACLQLFGGYGYTTEYPIARLYADARVQRIYAGTNEIMKELVARAL